MQQVAEPPSSLKTKPFFFDRKDTFTLSRFGEIQPKIRQLTDYENSLTAFSPRAGIT
jgi:hypothetical protein